MPALNYHHLRYFWAIAHERNLTRAAQRLHVSQSALSVQLRQLEERLGQKLFERSGRRLALTEAGRIALDYADTIFRAGDELVALLQGCGGADRQPLRIGAVATLSRNFQFALLRPLIGRPDIELVLHSGSLRELLAQLGAHTLDLVLSNVAVPRDAGRPWHSHLIAQQPVSLVGKPQASRRRFRFPEDLRDAPLVLPGAANSLRASFDLLMDEAGIRPTIVAEVDDMAMLRLIARESDALTLVPPVVVRDELRAKLLVERCRIPQITESFFAISPSRRFPNPLVRELLATRGGLPPPLAGAR
ncbi:MAG: LysR family transcriptional regulator [Burkholderiaceae bacterium]|jgi:LysR family transcriptional activator of nhaA|nr:LysR family transcriptional regulator [Burkholderiaceae bacterium]